MAYFPNGTAGEIWEDDHCNNCLHQFGPDNGSGCAVWLAHLLHNYDECNKENSILDIFIPRSKDGLGNGDCQMFVDKSVLSPMQRQYHFASKK